MDFLFIFFFYIFGFILALPGSARIEPSLAVMTRLTVWRLVWTVKILSSQTALLFPFCSAASASCAVSVVFWSTHGVFPGGGSIPNPSLILQE